MEILTNFFEKLIDLIPTAASLVVVIIVLLVVRAFMNRSSAPTRGRHFRRQMITLLLSFVGLLVVILSLPVGETMIGQLLSLIGILLSAAIALSATTFVGNIMAGLMLRAVRNFRGGDFVQVKEHFGRVSERGLFHVEIQTEESNLTTLPNLFLVTNPVRVIRSSGTLVTAEVSLGYDVPRDQIQKALREAAEATGLKEPFVHVINLGDFSVTYRVAGLLEEVKSLLSTRSRLREMMLDHLHSAEIEIVSPTFMNQRALDRSDRFLAMPSERAPSPSKRSEAVVFNKAEEAESLERLAERRDELTKQIKQLKKLQSESTAPDDLTTEIEQLEASLEKLSAYIDAREADDAT